MPTLVDPRPQRDEPHPVARPHQVVGAQPAVAGVDAALPVGVGRPVVELERLGDAPPRGVGLVRARPAQAELALQEAAPAGGVHDPPAGDVVRCAGLGEVDGVVRVAEDDVGGDGAIEDVAALPLVLLEQEVLEPAAVELIARDAREAARAELVAVRAGRGSGRRRRSSGCRTSAAAARPCAGRARAPGRSSGRRSRRSIRRPCAPLPAPGGCASRAPAPGGWPVPDAVAARA